MEEIASTAKDLTTAVIILKILAAFKQFDDNEERKDVIGMHLVFQATW